MGQVAGFLSNAQRWELVGQCYTRLIEVGQTLVKSEPSVTDLFYERLAMASTTAPLQKSAK